MFEFVAKHKRLIQIGIVLAIVPPFAFFGLESYTRSLSGGGEVASVDGMSISQREFADALARQLDRARAMLGRDLDVAQFDTPQTRSALLESLIAERLLVSEVTRARMLLGREEVIAEITRAPEFQQDGKFSAERYQAYLRLRGLSDEGNVAMLQVDLPVARLAGSVSGTAILPRAVAERLLALETQRREVSEGLVATEQFLAQVDPSEAQLKAYYQAHAAELGTPERVRAEYVVLSAEELGRAEPIAEAELKAAYEARGAQYGVDEQRRASHILVKSREEAERLASEARKAPARFPELAKRHSQDPLSAEKGGDLGLFGRGDMVKAFADAAYGMKEGEIAGPVQTEFGFHVIRLTEIRPAKKRPFEEVRAELAAELARQKGARRFAEVADAFNNLVYEQSDSLKPAAERFGLKIHQAGWLTRQPSPEHGLLAHPKVIAALFSPDSVQQRRNTDAFEVAPRVLLAARVAEHQPAARRAFEEVKPEVEKAVRREEAVKLARKEGAEKFAQLRSGADAGIKWAPAKLVSRREPQGMDENALRAVMAADAAKLPAYAGVDRGERGYALYRIARVAEGEPMPDAQKQAEIRRLQAERGASQLEAYVASLRARADVEINRANLEKK
jgi:peptidyl-prolyl cis-trans isomerase D